MTDRLPEIDSHSGVETTGHEWDGIKELNNPLPRWWRFIFWATVLVSIVYWILMPAWPALPGMQGNTTGVLGQSDRVKVAADVSKMTTERAALSARLALVDAATILKDQSLSQLALSLGEVTFADNCAACHGIDGKGRANYPNLTDDDWQWGGDVQRIAETISVGVNTANPDSRLGEMPRFGVDQMLPREDIEKAANYVYSLSNPDHARSETAETIAAGREVFVANCATCHGEDARGKPDVGAPNLTDKRWLYGGDLETIITTIHGGRRGHMPTWDQRLTLTEIKILALYVHSLGAGDS